MPMERISIKSDRVALYCRVSTITQTTENQKMRLLQYTTDHKLKYDLYEETESSRKTRPVKQLLMQKLRKGEYTGVIIYKLDRWARSSRELILDTTELIEKGISFISVSDNLDFSTAAGKFFFHLLSAFSEFERELIRERTIQGLIRTKQQGTQLGRPVGAKDSKSRKTSGYIIREANKRKSADEMKGNYLSVESYIKQSPPK